MQWSSVKPGAQTHDGADFSSRMHVAPFLQCFSSDFEHERKGNVVVISAVFFESVVIEDVLAFVVKVNSIFTDAQLSSVKPGGQTHDGAEFSSRMHVAPFLQRFSSDFEHDRKVGLNVVVISAVFFGSVVIEDVLAFAVEMNSIFTDAPVATPSLVTFVGVEVISAGVIGIGADSGIVTGVVVAIAVVTGVTVVATAVDFVVGLAVVSGIVVATAVFTGVVVASAVVAAVVILGVVVTVVSRVVVVLSGVLVASAVDTGVAVLAAVFTVVSSIVAVLAGVVVFSAGVVVFSAGVSVVTASVVTVSGCVSVV